MQVIVTPDPGAAFQQAASIIAGEIRSNPSPVLGLATGRTMEGIYSLLVQDHLQNGLDFSATTSFNLDEYVGLSASNPQSYRHYMNDHLFAHVNMRADHVHVPDGLAEDLNAECQAYEQAIHDAGGIGLQLLGIGETGHIGFNEPPSPFDSRTRQVTLHPVTRRQNAGMFGGDANKVPEKALTMGVGTILDARHLLLVACGRSKADIIARALLDTVTPDVSASALRLHPHCTVILDTAAARMWQERSALVS
ncbi:glucosamine-6-phosphate deaminase [Gluconobacter frateurii]|uniref:Glucosamine-6-phosphate deaminase n=1 Tax=Gluconobacter frateurii NRIC 0228 TaxID=1307946 RepID=A0ABQ0Q8I7_9PROT|nr:glucosamine-6-phosphate deaminase [Gluconobacter frateurii]GBR09016.1 6-phosphogluconolactonase [Gluconobacter frateurii NRIC 0228]GLP90897.1 putative glucosamine-6-phosphate deaminase 2 [Gluconobacter frateurii]